MEDAIRKYATSLVIMEKSMKDGKLHAFPSLWREATAILRSYSVEQNLLEFPDTLDLQLRYMKTPLNQWGYPELSTLFMEDYFYDEEPILYENGVTEFCHELAIPLSEEEDPRRYLETESFVNAMNVVEDEEYVQLRSFPVHYPVLSQKDWLLGKKKVPEAFINTLLRMYESIPEECIDEQSIYLCPYCGWTLHRKRGEWSCNREKCRDFIFRLNRKWEPKAVPYTRGMQRVKQGVLQFLVIPGIPEHRIYKKVQEYAIDDVQLYPNKDETDTLITWKSGERWAIDAKDWYSHYDLMTHLKQKDPFSKLNVKVKRKIILIPRHYPAEYVRAVQNFLEGSVEYEILHEKKLYEKMKSYQTYQKAVEVSRDAPNF
ncbi:hypothetical protein [Pontibacillus sp. ALD_SL1]|uniref:restriction endonuclease-related protein n=1 Tax=Pontibacillus sp. ALD_SL1 TaxID=2777185 RepID=UPI0035304EAE